MDDLHYADHVYYVYAVARSHSPQRTLTLPTEGIVPQSPVVSVPYQDLFAMISAVPCDEFGAEALPIKLQETEWTYARVLAHQHTLEQLMANCTIVPLKFCTLYTSIERVRDMIETHYLELTAALNRLDGATEWGVKLFCDRHVLAAWVEESAPEVQHMRRSMEQKSEGAAFFMRKRLDTMIGNVVGLKVETCADEFHNVLRPYARESTTNTIAPQQNGDAQPELILNAAYLVADTAHHTFIAALDQLAATYGAQGFHYELTGPWPPYTFAYLELSEAPHELIPLER